MKKRYNNLVLGGWSRPHMNISRRRRYEKRMDIIIKSLALLPIIFFITFHAISFIRSKPDKSYTQMSHNCSDSVIIQTLKSNRSDAYKANYIEKCFNDKLTLI